MEYGSIDREIFIDASPEMVFDVVSRPEHITQWWSDEADIEAVGVPGHIVFRGSTPGEEKIVPLMVVEADKPRRFSFRWDFQAGALPRPDNSLLVTFELQASGKGTLLKMTETGFREQGWEAAVLEANYQDHVNGWNYFIPRIGDYVTRLVDAS